MYTDAEVAKLVKRAERRGLVVDVPALQQAAAAAYQMEVYAALVKPDGRDSVRRMDARVILTLLNDLVKAEREGWK